nr:hypothetical protein [Candidatus Methanomethylophilus sp. 1R26]
MHFDSVKLGAACYDAGTGKTEYFFRDRIPGYYHARAISSGQLSSPP